jgi:UDP-N-acetylglucosamine/UDP-N-acetylgalactosamine diphosphorylase
LQSPGKLAKGPDGNGNCLRLLYHSEIWEKWKKRGVEYLNVIQVDNALADPFDTGFLGFHAYRKNDASMKCIFRQNETEKVGVIVSFQGKLKVIEYSELSEECGKKDAEGRLLYPLANIGSFCFSMEFIKKHALHSEPLPWHVANKMVQAWDHQVLEGKKKKQAWKFEYFLFDVFEEVQKAAVLVSPRETCYAALKNESGDKSIGTVQEALIAQDRRIFKKITGIEPPDSIFELAPSFSYGSSEQLKKWKAKSWPKLSYIDPSSL